MRVGIVGAGITGVALTHHLTKRGVTTVTYEATDTAGGVIESVHHDDVVLEYGPQRFRRSDAVEALADTAGLTEDLVTADPDLPVYVYAADRLREVPLSLSAFLRTDLLSWSAKLRLLKEPFTDPIDGDESAAAAFRRKFGDETYEHLIGPLFGGTYASDPAEMPAEHALSGLMRIEQRDGSLLRPALRRVLGRNESPPPMTVRGGNQRLVTALADVYADRIVYDTPVQSIVADGDEYVLDLPSGADRVDAVVVTTPAPSAADILADVGDNTGGLAELTYNPLAYAFLRTDYDRPGLGYQVTRSSSLDTLGVTWNGVAFGRDDLVTCFLGGMPNPGLLEENDETIGEIAVEEFETVTGATADVITVTRNPAAIPAYDRSWHQLESVSLPDDVYLATNYTARVGVPGRIREAERLATTLATET